MEEKIYSEIDFHGDVEDLLGRKDPLEEFVESLKYKNNPRCHKCTWLVIPYAKRVDRRGHPIPQDEWECTCRLNKDCGNGEYGLCEPDKCNNGTEYYN